MIKEEIKRVLKSIGLTNNEISIYMDLLQYGKSSAMTISKRTMVHRPNVYDSVEKLIEKGLVFQTIEEQRKVFNPASPKNLLRYLNEKEYDLKQILPEIEAIKIKEKFENLTISSEGLSAVKSAIYELLQNKKEILIQGFAIESHQLLTGFMLGFYKEITKEKIPIKQLYPETILETIKISAIPKNVELRTYKSKNPEKTSTIISGNSIIFISWDKPIYLIFAKNKFLVEKFKDNFIDLWEKSKKI